MSKGDDYAVKKLSHLKALSHQLGRSIRDGTEATHNMSSLFIQVLQIHLEFISEAVKFKKREVKILQVDNVGPNVNLEGMLRFGDEREKKVFSNEVSSDDSLDDSTPRVNDMTSSSNSFFTGIAKKAAEAGIESDRFVTELGLGAGFYVLMNMASVAAITGGMIMTQLEQVMPKEKGENWHHSILSAHDDVNSFAESVGFDLYSSSPACSLADVWDECTKVLNSKEKSEEMKQQALRGAHGLFIFMSNPNMNAAFRKVVSIVIKRKAGDPLTLKETEEEDVYASDKEKFRKLVRSASMLFLAQFLPLPLRTACGDDVANYGQGIFLASMRLPRTKLSEASGIFWASNLFSNHKKVNLEKILGNLWYVFENAKKKGPEDEGSWDRFEDFNGRYLVISSGERHIRNLKAIISVYDI